MSRVLDFILEATGSQEKMPRLHLHFMRTRLANLRKTDWTGGREARWEAVASIQVRGGSGLDWAASLAMEELGRWT